MAGRGNGASAGEAMAEGGGQEDEEEDGGEEEEEEEARAGSSSSSNAGLAMAMANGGRLSVSARKLAASLWGELQDANSSSPCSHLQSRPSPISATSDSPAMNRASILLHASKPPELPRKSPQMRTAASTISPTPKPIAIIRPKPFGEHGNGTHGSPLGMDALKSAANKFQLAQAGMVTSPRDYVKAFNRLLSLEEQQSDSTSTVSTLHKELELARARIHELEAAEKSAGKEVEGLLKKYADERSREQEKFQAAFLSIGQQLEHERKARKKLELQNRKLSSDLSETNTAGVKAMKELDKERKARQLMEDVCDELAREIGEDKAEVEELKREHAKAREEIEEERKMLQMAEVWREERVQMKLSEARYELEANCMALDNLRFELEAFLSARTHQLQDGLEQQVEANKAQMLRGDVEKLQAQTAMSMRLMDATACQSSGSDNSGSSEDIHSLQLCKNNMKSESRWSVDHKPPPIADVSGRLWTNRKHSMRSSSQAALKSYGSRTRGLNRLDNRDLEEDSFRDGESRLEVESDDEASEWEYAGNSRYERREESNWSADQDDENGGQRDDESAWQSVTDMEEENQLGSSPELSGTRMYRLSDTSVRTEAGRHNRVIYDQSGNGHFFPHTSSNVFRAEDDSESAIGCSPNQQQRLNSIGSPCLRMQKGGWSFAEAGNKGVRREEKLPPVGSMDWPRPVRSNSLQAKLLEDGMDSPQYQPRHSRLKHKR